MSGIPPDLGGSIFGFPAFVRCMKGIDPADFVQTVVEPENAFTENGVLHLPPDASLPADVCVKCGRKSVRVATNPVRNPWNPLTWYTRETSLEVGLCSKHGDDRRIGLALTYSLLVVGFIFAVFGVAIGNLPMILLGTGAAGFSGFFRARNVVYRTGSSRNTLKIKGAGEHFLKRFSERGDSDRE